MTLLTRESILGANDLKTEDLEVPEWGGTVRLRTLSGSERDKFEQSMVEIKGNKQNMNLANLRARLVALVLVNEEGAQIFNAHDVKELGAKSALALDRVFQKAQEMNGLSDNAVEELTEGFDNAQSEPSTSD